MAMLGRQEQQCSKGRYRKANQVATAMPLGWLPQHWEGGYGNVGGVATAMLREQLWRCREGSSDDTGWAAAAMLGGRLLWHRQESRY